MTVTVQCYGALHVRRTSAELTGVAFNDD